MRKPILILVTVTIAVIAASVFLISNQTTPAGATSGGMEAMSIDMDIAGNDATTIGDRDECVETSAASVVIDVTALNILAGTPLGAGFSYILAYDSANLSITSADHELLANSAPGSNLLDAGDPTPDSDGAFFVAVADINAAASESGNGVLSRITIDTSGAAAGVYNLTLSEAAHIDAGGETHAANGLFGARLAVGGETCAGPTTTSAPQTSAPPGATATPTPTPTPTPAPTPTPSPTGSPDGSETPTGTPDGSETPTPTPTPTATAGPTTPPAVTDTPTPTPTPTPEPTDTATASPTPTITPAALPDTGGASNGSSITIALLLSGAGLLAISMALWGKAAVRRLRREL